MICTRSQQSQALRSAVGLQRMAQHARWGSLSAGESK